MKELVLDISRWDEDIDLQAWKDKHGVWGVIVKAGGNEKSLGRYVDPNFEQNYNKAIDAGLHVGFYYYTDTTTVAEANVDANHFISIIEGKFYDLPLYMDVEDTSQFELGPRKLTDVIKSFCNTLIYKGHYAGLYTGGYAWLNSMYREELSDYANWIAWWRNEWPTEAGDIGMWQQGGIRFDDGDIVFADTPGYHDCDWCVVDYPSRIINGMTKYEPEEPQSDNQNGSEVVAMGRASDVINAAYGELGYNASCDPEPGSKYGRWMTSITGNEYYSGPSLQVWWCCMFTSWALDKGNVQMAGFPSANTDAVLNNGGRAYAVNPEDVQYGDIVIFNWNWDEFTDHIGFATGSFDGYGFTTIEGNVNNDVQEQYRQLGNVAFVLRPPYNGHGPGEDIKPDVPAKPKNNRDGGELDTDGIGGWNTIIDLQHIFGTPEDGEISGQYPSNYRYHSGMSNVSYGSGGSQLVVAMQKRIGADPDGEWGPDTSLKLTQYLRNLGYSIKVCEKFDSDAVKVLQQAINDGALK
jgi:hypothetical protein